MEIDVYLGFWGGLRRRKTPQMLVRTEFGVFVPNGNAPNLASTIASKPQILGGIICGCVSNRIACTIRDVKPNSHESVDSCT